MTEEAATLAIEAPKPPKKKRKRGRPKLEFSQDQRDLVKSMAGLRQSVADIAAYVGIGEASVRKHFKEELRLGKIEVNIQIAQSLFDKAVSNQPGAITAAIHLGNLWLGMGLKAPESPTGPPANSNDGGDGAPKQASKILVEFVKPPVWPDDPPLPTDEDVKRIG